ncbi:hypothetical protein SCATT_03680 [Streptantibioticus cattleyicolor NRRL 8057 = DSM 46488]|uniref:Uncharacterized protein n=1 Tax=Streptantibioticus cattleyicolor (strain ATCC 35852 / DSM 46488 / JCM 4925 / NBRC 14057 / NRRL 8057) TaxID=1003195 RepID=G8WN18_STREN|nr:hypothetical protein SCATT_03680 [Streptantibioticus cattleyicolor NRRL 8057 = DSM 46488]
MGNTAVHHRLPCGRAPRVRPCSPVAPGPRLPLLADRR